RGGRLCGVEADRLETIASRDGPPVGRLAPSTDPDRDLVRGLREHADLVEVIVVAGEVDGIVTPAGAQQVDDLVGAAAAIVERLPEGFELARRPAHADAQCEPAATQRVEAGERVGQLEDAVARRDQDTGADAN